MRMNMRPIQRRPAWVRAAQCSAPAITRFFPGLHGSSLFGELIAGGVETIVQQGRSHTVSQDAET